jgi:heme exporter protein C
MLKKYWWKVLAILLLLYTFVAGLGIPMGAGIRSISPVRIGTAGLQTLTLTSYNADYQEDIRSNVFKIRLRLNKNEALCSKSVRTDTAGQILVDFEIPAGQLPVDTTPLGPNKRAPYPLLEVSSPRYGYSSVQSALAFVPTEGEVKADLLCAVAADFADANPQRFPFLHILEETIRNLFFHVPMWFGMMLLLLVSAIYSIRYLRNPQNEYLDHAARSFAAVGLLYGILGIVTGAVWARFTWGAWWSWDVKQNTSAVALLIYMAYFVLRGSFEDMDKQARVAAVYNIFAFATLIPLLYIVPRMVDSLHPGMGGNPAFNSYDLDNALRIVFYPSILAWILIGVWLAQIGTKVLILRQQAQEVNEA